MLRVRLMETLRADERERVARRADAGGGTGAERLYAPRSPDERRRSAQVLAGGSIAEAIGGAGAIVLSILGLSGFMPVELAAGGCIAIGVAFIAQGASILVRWSGVVREAQSYQRDPQVELGGGMSAELIGGAAGIVLGVMALVGLAPFVLVASALVVFGVALLFGSPALFDLSQFGSSLRARGRCGWRETSIAASGMQLLVSVAAIVLGTVALAGVRPVLVPLAGLLVIGVTILLVGAAVGGRLLSVVRD